MFLRKTALDEIPEFWNVLTGDMTLVGPRPLTEWQIRYLDEERIAREFRLRLRPGLTGIWLDAPVKPRQRTYEEKITNLLREQEMLHRYMKTRSASVDISILMQAIISFLIGLFAVRADKELET